MISKQIIYFQDKAYILIRRILDNPKYIDDNLDLLMKWLDADKVLRKDGYLFFLEEIEEAEVLGFKLKTNIFNKIKNL
jgi:hypothetical protein